MTWQWSKFDLLRLHRRLFRSFRTIISGFLFAWRPQRPLPPPFTTVRSPDSTTDRSPSLLPRVQRFSQEAFMKKAKRKKEECEPTTKEDNKRGKQGDEISFFKEPAEKKVRAGEVCRIKSVKLHFDLPVWFVSLLNSTYFTTVFLPLFQSAQRRTTKQRSDVFCASGTFNNPNVSDDGRREKPLQELNVSHQRHQGKDSECSVPVTADQVIL